MNDKFELLLIGCKMKKDKFINIVKERFIYDEDGNLVETVLIIVIFALAVILVSNVIGGALKSKGNEAAKIISEGSLN